MVYSELAKKDPVAAKIHNDKLIIELSEQRSKVQGKSKRECQQIINRLRKRNSILAKGE